MKKLNCWEFKKCGREVGGENADELGVCPASINEECDGNNNGVAAGRWCWKVAGTLCAGRVQGTFAQKIVKCSLCNFYKLVESEEGEEFKP